MKYALISIFSILIFISCKKKDDQAVLDEAIIKTYLTEHPEIDATRHSSGLYYQILKPGNGASPNVGSSVTVKYKGYFTNGDVFDQSPSGEFTTFKLFEVITGWQIGIPLLKKGGKALFIIPSGLGYGSQKRSGIPANSVLIFEVDLVGFR